MLFPSDRIHVVDIEVLDISGISVSQPYNALSTG